MADSIRTWICAYLIDTGESYGGSLTDVPFWEKKKKVQLVEFLTYPNSVDDMCPIFAKVSDKLHKIPVRFTADALKAFGQKHNGSRLTEYRNAIIQIKNFRPLFARIPVGNNVRKQSPDSHLLFEVGSVDILGSDGEGEFGNPKDVEENEKVMAWTEGLREHGGGGNVLKLRKEAEQASSEAKTSTSPTRVSRIPPRKTIQSPPKRVGQVGKKRAESGSKSTSISPPKTGIHMVKHPRDLYNRSFRSILKDPELFKIGFRPQAVKDQQRNLTFDKDLPVASTSIAASEEPPPPAQRPARRRSPPTRHALDLDSSQPQVTSPERKQSPLMQTTPTPSEWPPSPSSPSNGDDVLKMEVDSEHENEPQPTSVPASRDIPVPEAKSSPSPKTSSHLSAPTPAQRPKPLSPSASSSPASSPAKVPSSPTPLYSMTTPSQPQNSPASSLPVHVRRRVSYPTPPAPPDPEISGFGRILVPNSDTSGQSQSQSQARSDQQHALQSNFLPAPSQDGLQAHTNGNLPIRDKTGGRRDLPEPQQSIRASQPESYDGDRSSPDVPSQLGPAMKKQRSLERFDTAFEAVKARSLLKRSQANGHLGSDNMEHRESHDVEDEEEVDQLQSDGELPDDRRNDSVVVERSPERDLSGDDAQIHAMLTADAPQNVKPQMIPDPEKAPAMITPPPKLSSQIDVKQGEGSTTTSRSLLASAMNDSHKQTRAASAAPSLLSPFPSKDAKVLQDSGPSFPRVNDGVVSSPRPAEVEHDAEAWRNPSFMQSANKGQAKPKPTVRTTKTPAQNDRAASHSRATLPVASSIKKFGSTNSSLHKLDTDASISKTTSTDGQISHVIAPTAIVFSRPNKRDRDRLSESSSRSDARGDSGSGIVKKKKVKIGESGSRAVSTPGRSGVQDHDVHRGMVRPSLISDDPPADPESGSRKKRKAKASGSGSRATSTSSGRSGAQDHDVRVVTADGEKVRSSLTFNDAPADSGYGSKMRRRIEADESGSRSASASSGQPKVHVLDVHIRSPRADKQNGKSLPDDEPLLKGYTFNLRNLPQEAVGRRLRTWRDLEATLLSVGRHRTKEPR